MHAERAIPLANDYELVVSENASALDESEQIGNAVNVDEMDQCESYEESSISEEYSSDDENIAQQHLHEIVGEDDEESIDVCDEKFDDLFSAAEIVSPQDIFNQYHKCCEWSWSMCIKSRQLAVYKLVKTVCLWIKYLCKEAENFVDEARRICAQASGSVLKSAVVIGGTIVGAANRLSALRASEPFAVIVEEACEVMEPTLVSVLSVPSVQKVQLIGDHRQLPAFVNNCWYDLSNSTPALKTSLFERLVVGDSDGRNVDKGICSILDVQRRMRSAVSNLTKDYYADVVEIQDHCHTFSQKVGDKLNREICPKNPCMTYWSSSGRHVPGMSRSVFFWDVPGNKESANKMGLSACNDIEADAVTQLVKFLLLCGINKSSITVITPYTGQKRLLVQKFMKENIIERRKVQKFSDRTNGRYAQEVDSVLVSTLDRYQGDENDIVILSLVRARPGNRFVGLLNRFIVASSRARLGFYIVGSKSAVVDCKHWSQLLKTLDTEVDTEDDHESGEVFRCGEHIPTCCPQHRARICPVTAQNASFEMPRKDSWQQLCQEKCGVTMQCGHECKSTCHFLKPDMHCECQEMLKRPCSHHEDVPLRCGTIQLNPNESLQDALNTRWKCTIKSVYKLPCGHDKVLQCCEHEAVLELERQCPKCEEIVADFHFPKCDHVIKNPKCCDRQRYERDPPICSAQLNVIRSECNHEEKMKCDDVVERKYDACNKMVNEKRPRCGHIMSIRCKNYQILKKIWNDAGHIGWEDLGNGALNTIDAEVCYGPAEGTILSKFVDRCKKKIDVKRSCGHTKTMLCDDAFKALTDDTLPSCEEMTSVVCHLCQKEMSIPCCLKTDYENWCPFPNSAVVMHDQCVVVLEKEIGQEVLRHPPPDLWKAWRSAKCNSKVLLQRACNADHTAQMLCHDVVMRIGASRGFDKCIVDTSRVLPCNHLAQVKCHKKNVNPPPRCFIKNEKEIRFPCGHSIKPKSCGEYQNLIHNSMLECEAKVNIRLCRCGHINNVLCKYNEAAQPRLGDTLGTTQGRVRQGQRYCDGFDVVTCLEPVTFEKDCGHILVNVECDLAFQWASKASQPPLCRELIALSSPLCGHEIYVPCHLLKEVAAWQPFPDNHFHGTSDMRIFELPFPHQPSPLPEQLRSVDSIRCSKKTRVIFKECNHSMEVDCCELLQCLDGKMLKKFSCLAPVNHQCRGCGTTRQINCCDYRTRSAEDIDNCCEEIITLECRTCNVNPVDVKCNRRFPECGRKVECVMLCGHSAKPWVCGKEFDPRLGHDKDSNLNVNCAQCVKQKWIECRDKEIDLEDLKQAAKQWMLTELESDDDSLRKYVEMNVDFLQYDKARDTSLSKYIEAVETQVVSDMKLPPNAGLRSTAEYLESFYDLVYLQIPAKNDPTPDGITKRFRPIDTIYGSGKQVSIFNKEAIEKLSASDGSVKFCLAMAFKCNMLTGEKPFVPNIANKDMLPLAIRKMNDFQKLGFDCVEIEGDGVEVKDSALQHSDRIYWLPGAIVPVSIVNIELNGVCQICMDPFPRKSKLGALCPDGHFLCYENCFPHYLSSAEEAGSIGRSSQDGLLKCPGCSSCYNALKLASFGCPEEIVTKLHDFEMNYKINASNNKVREEEKEKFEKERKRLQKMDEEEREVHLICYQINEDILTNKCPRCKQAFTDFYGCLALTCHRQDCRAGFCGLCFKDCGRDAHNHVARCEYNRLGSYGSMEQVNEVWKTIRRNKINELFKKIDKTAVRKKVSTKMQAEFIGLGIQLA